MNDLSNFWQSASVQQARPSRKPSPPANTVPTTTDPAEKKPALAETKPTVEKTRRRLPFGPKPALLAAAILLAFGVLIGANLPRRESGAKLLLDIKNELGEEAKLAGTELNRPEPSAKDKTSGTAVLGTAETNEGKIKVLSANLVGIWEKTKTDNKKPGFEDKKNSASASASKESPEAGGAGAKVKPFRTPDKEAAPNQSSEVAPESGADRTNVALSKSALKPRNSKPEPELRLVGVRIMGEIKNVGGSTVYGVNVFVRFYGNKEKKPSSDSSAPGASPRETSHSAESPTLVAVKVGSWNRGYKFLPLAPGETGVYDVVVPNPPEFQTVTIDTKIDPTIKKSDFVTDSLKIKNKSLEPTTLRQSGQQINYFTFNGTLVNTGKAGMVDPSVYVWLKNGEGKVIGLATKTLLSDLLMPNQELPVGLIVVPTTADAMAGFEVRAFGKQL